jgi:hypothetical protein
MTAVDVLKTKYMSDTTGRYATPMQCAVDSVREGGLRVFLKVEQCRVGKAVQCHALLGVTVCAMSCRVLFAGLDTGLHAYRPLHGAGLRAYGAGEAFSRHEDFVACPTFLSVWSAWDTHKMM